MIRLLVFLVFLISLPKVLSAQCTELTSNLQCELGIKSHTFKVFCTAKDGATYSGFINCSGRMTGYGEAFYPDGGSYMGNWIDSKRNGEGTEKYAPGSRYKSYTGQWLNNKRHGDGIMNYTNGDQFKGQWLNNKRHGYGNYYFVDGHVFNGHFLNGKMHGKGTFKFASGQERTGIWKNGNLDGKYTYTYKSGKVTEQLWDNNEFVGEETIKKGKSKLRLKIEKRISQIRLTIKKLFVEIDKPEVIAKDEKRKIYNNCIIDKLTPDANRTLQQAIKDSCRDIANTPSFFEKMKYD